MPPLGCVPSQRTVAGGPTRSCVGRFNDATKLYNAKLSANLDSLSRNLRENTLIYIDIYDSLLEIILDPQQYGKYFYPFFPAGPILYITINILILKPLYLNPKNNKTVCLS